MDRVEERELVRTLDWAMHTCERDQRFTADDLCGLHKRWLGDVYSWAGTYRQVNVSKAGFMFAAAAQVPRLMQEFEATCLEQFTPPGTVRHDIPLALATMHAELLLIHPFREGNGRMARLLAKLMSLQAGIRISGFDALVRQRREEYFAAVRAGLDRDYEPMRALFASIIDGEKN